MNKKKLITVGLTVMVVGCMTQTVAFAANHHGSDSMYRTEYDCNDSFHNVYRLKKGQTLKIYSLDAKDKNKVNSDGKLKATKSHSSHDYVILLSKKNSFGQTTINGTKYHGIVDSSNKGHYIKQSDLNKLKSMSEHDF